MTTWPSGLQLSVSETEYDQDIRLMACQVSLVEFALDLISVVVFNVVR